MKKLIFRNLNTEITKFFFLSALSMTVIVWVIQAVNLLDFISEDGHSFKIYFIYTILNFPKIFSKILPFMFFISLFYTLNKFEEKNELMIFWLCGIRKFQFLRNLLTYSLFFLLFQIFLTTYVVPTTQDMARSFIRSSTMGFLPNIIKEKKFIDAVSNLTIYIEKKEENGEFLNIFLKEKLKKNNQTQIIYAKKGNLINNNGEHWLIMRNGKIINQKEKQSTVISFDTTQINLSNYSTKTTLFPKLKEQKTTILLSCAKALYTNNESSFKDDYLVCAENNSSELVSEILRRLYQPLYLPVLALIVCFLTLTAKDSFNYNMFKLKVFITSTFILVISEISLNFSTPIIKQNFLFFLIPIILSIFAILIYLRKLKFLKTT
jgi:lipopolysaccharide export system permease protein